MAITRRKWMGLAAAAGIAAGSRFSITEAFAGQSSGKYSSAWSALDGFIREYIKSMNAPGMTLVLADRDGIQRIATYGFTDPQSKQSVQPNELFEIGSITKSFLAIVLLQLHDENKLDLQKPVLEYLPWWRIDAKYGAITTHHLLTHTSGLDSGPLFLSDAALKHRSAYAPGEHFHYNNMAFSTMGYLVEALDGRPFSAAVKARVFEPLGMTASEPVITFDIRSRLAKNWWSYMGDRHYPRYGALCEAPQIVITEAAGSIASTPHDMGLYIQMIANAGKGPKGRIISEQGWAMFSKPWIKAEEFGPTASYGYGIAVDKLEDHTILRHTGGMVSFASALQIDVDAGVGAFASINAMQGYRPNPPVLYAHQLMRALGEKKKLPTAPELTSPTKAPEAADYAGTFKSSDGRTLQFTAKDQQLFVAVNGASIVLENEGDGKFLAAHPSFDRYAFVFARADEKDPKSPVVEVGWGPDWYTNEKYKGPRQFDHPAEWNTYIGHYRNESPWNGSIRLVVRKGKLMIDGEVKLELAPDGVFLFTDDEWNTEWIKFFDGAQGKAMRLKLSGEDFWRVDAA